MPIDDVDYTATGYYRAVAPDGTFISRHRLENEAEEACFNHAKNNGFEGVNDYIIEPPSTRMSIRIIAPAGGNRDPIAPDVDPPLAPVGVGIDTVTTSSLRVFWSSNSEPDIQDYRVYYSSTGPASGFSLWATVTAPTVQTTITGLSESTQYWVYVTARDNALNESPASSVVSDTTDTSTPQTLTGIFVDGQNGSDSYDGTSPVFTSGTTGPKATVSAGISACSIGDSLYLVNGQSYGFATYDLDWNSGANSSQAAELAGCYISGGQAFRWTEASGEPRPIVNFRMRSTNDYFTIHGLQTSTASYTLLASSVWNFTLSYIQSTRTTDDTQAGVFWFYNGRNGQRMINILNCSFTWADGLNWALGTDYVKIDTGYRYGEIAYNTFTRAHHDCLGLLGSNFWVHHNTFDNTSVAGTTGYRACSFNVERDLPPDEDDGGEPYGENLIENNTFISATTPGVENTAPIIKMQNKRTIYRFNTFDAFCSTTNADVFQIQTCCSDPFASHLAPLVADQRFYNNTITASGFQRWSRVRTFQTDGSAGNQENTRTENHDNWIFNNHFSGEPLASAEALWEFQQIASAYRVGNVISQNKVEYNTYSSSRTSAFIQDATNGQQTLATAESNFPSYINNNTVNSSGGAGFGRDIATTVGSGTGTTMTVTDAGSFMPTITDSVNGEVYSGDVISVNGQTATVTGRNLAANTLTLSTSLTWTDGQAVNLDGYVAGYTGVAPESAHGSNVTITGSGFGTNSAGLAAEFIGGATGQLETQTLGTNAPDFGSWTVSYAGQPEKVSVSDADRGKVWRTTDSVVGSAQNGIFTYDYGSDIPLNSPIYVSWWTKKDSSENNGQWKMLRVNGRDAALSSVVDGGLEFVFFNWGMEPGAGYGIWVARPFGGGSTAGAVSHYVDSSNPNGSSENRDGTIATPKGDDQWYRNELYMEPGDVGVANSRVRYIVHRPAGDRVIADFQAVMLNADATRFRYFLFQNWLGNNDLDTNPVNILHHDDHYIQVGSFKRVELCDSATYSASTVREIQRITAWSDTSVTVELNEGGLASGTYYLHVVDDDTSLGSKQVSI